MVSTPNNHALDGGPATSEMEKEAVEELARILGLKAPTLGHLTASGTIANLEARVEALQVGRGTVAREHDLRRTDPARRERGRRVDPRDPRRNGERGDCAG